MTRLRLAAALLLLLTAIVLASADETAASKREPMPRALTDIGMYDRIAERLAEGGDYYSAAAAEHRENGYPLQPFYVVRPPALAWMTQAIGQSATIALAKMLAVLGALAWAWQALRSRGLATAVGAGAAIAAGGFLTFYHQQLYHELWAGLFLALAAAAYRRGRPEPAAALALVAVLFREHALLMPGIFGMFALARKDGREIAAWLVCAGLAAAYYVAHFLNVSAVLNPSDAVSPGWAMAPGPNWALGNLARIGLLRLLGPAGPVFALIAITGWLGYRGAGAQVYCFLMSMVAVLAFLARPDNYYWAFLAYPLILGGLAFFPAFAIAAAQDLRRGAISPSVTSPSKGAPPPIS